MPVMCILGGAGNRGGVREHFCSALSHIYVRCVVDAVACHPKPPARLTPKWSGKLAANSYNALPGNFPPSLTGCCLAQDHTPPGCQPSSHNWSTSRIKDQSPCLNQDSSEGPPLS